MPADVITLNAVARELNKTLSGGRIDKICQPEEDEITLLIRSGGANHTLVVSANPSHPRIHLTSQKKENSLVAPTFCMLLRKYLTGGNIVSIGLLNCDRAVRIEFEARNELKDSVRFSLIAELMGRHSNIILVDEKYVIVDAIKRIHPDQSISRYILPNITYPEISQTKIRLDDTEKLKKFFAENSELSVDALMQNISGISKETAKELLSEDNRFDAILRFFNINENTAFSPCVLKKDGEPKDYHIFPYKTIAGEFIHLPTLNSCLDYYYTVFDKIERKKEQTKQLNKALKRLVTKTQKKIEDNLEKLDECQRGEELKQKGELILSNLYLIKRGDESLKCYDYYNDKEIEIALDPLINPAENAQSYFKRYTKLKRAKEIATQQLEKLRFQAEYLKDIEVSIQNCDTRQEFEEILQELNNLRGIKKLQKGAKLKQKPSQPIHVLIDGFDVYAGKNNMQNIEVTFKIGESNDVWLHTKNYHGSHVIIKGNPSQKALYGAACLAAYYSEGKNSDKVEVDYTLRKNVKKIPSSFMGLVTYTNFKTILAKPEFVSD